MKKHYAQWFLILVAVSAILAAACTSKNDSSQPVASNQQDQQTMAEQKPAATSEQNPAMTATASPAPSVPVEVTGKVENTDAGIVIATNMFDYHVTGQDLTSMIGKTVRAKGTVQESDGKYSISVESVQEVPSE